MGLAVRAAWKHPLSPCIPWRAWLGWEGGDAPVCSKGSEAAWQEELQLPWTMVPVLTLLQLC